MKTLKINRITNCLCLFLLTLILSTITFKGNAQPIDYIDPSYTIRIANSDSRMVYTIEETETTVKLRVMLIGPFKCETVEGAITYDGNELMATDPAYGANIPLYEPPVGPPIKNGNVDRSRMATKLYPNYEVYCRFIRDLAAPGPHNRKYYGSNALDPYYVPPAPALIPPGVILPEDTLMQRPAKDMHPIWNMYFKKLTPGRKVQPQDFGFLRYPVVILLGANYDSYFGIVQLMISNSRGLAVHNKVNLPDMFVFRSPSDVVTDNVSEIQPTTAKLNANFKRGNIPPRKDMLFSTVLVLNEADTGRLNWDTVTHRGFLYYSTPKPGGPVPTVTVNDICDSITVDGITYPFPTAAAIAGLGGSTTLNLGGVILELREEANPSSSQYINYSKSVTGLNTYTNLYHVWSYIRYSFETSKPYLLVEGPKRLTKLVDCAELDSKSVLENGGGIYTHSGTAWDAESYPLFAIDSSRFYAPTATPSTGTTTLNGVQFPNGTHTVTWISWNGTDLSDTCVFTVTVSNSFLNCPAMTDKYVQEDNPGPGYRKTGTDWNIIKKVGITLTDSVYTLTGVTTGTGDDLNGVTFAKGVTLVTWAGRDFATGEWDTCYFNVTVYPEDLLDCSHLSPNHFYVQENITGYYKHNNASWNAQPAAGVTLDTLYYQATTTVIPHEGTILDTVSFPIGTTHVKWIGIVTGGFSDTCEFDVTVYPQKFLNCTALGGNKDTVETGKTGYYKHIGATWNVTIVTPIPGHPGLTLDSIYYKSDKALPATNNTLDQTQFPIGITAVRWYGVIHNPGGGADFVDSCDIFNVKVRPSYFIECDLIGDQYVQESAAGSSIYAHTGTAWDPTSRTGVAFVDSTFTTFPVGATPATTPVTTGKTLNGINFPVGTTHVRWIAEDALGTFDTCYFYVYVSERQFLNCSSLAPNKVVNETTPTGYYTNTGSGWDVKAKPGFVLSDSSYVYYIGAAKQEAKTLNGKQFPAGVNTFVKWYGKIVTPKGDTFIDSCYFYVTVLPNKLLNCPATLSKTAMENAPVGFYTHAGTLWNVQTRTDVPVPLASNFYDLSGGATLSLPTTLDGAAFPVVGTPTTVKYIVEADYTLPEGAGTRTVFDTCTFTVTVLPLSLLNCAHVAMSDKSDIKETRPTQGYDHVGSDWDAVPDVGAATPGLTVTIHYEVINPDASKTIGLAGQSLNGYNFDVGVSTVTWYAIDNFLRKDSCKFTVTIDPLPVAVLDCSGLKDQLVGSDYAGATFYTHMSPPSISWDAKPGDPILTILDTLYYKLRGATTGSGPWTLDGVVFNLGKTTVTWVGKDQYGFIDSCKFVVTVEMTCPSTINYFGKDYVVTPLAGLCWTENMATTQYDGGGTIPFAKPYVCPTCPADLDTIFGLLYTWYSAVNVPEGSTTLPTPETNGHIKGICPPGTHIPSQVEMNLLNLYPVADLKSVNYWLIPGTNATGFNALPAGLYNGAIDRFEDMYGSTGWWTSASDINNLSAFYHFISYYCQDVKMFDALKTDGLSVRCILDY